MRSLPAMPEGRPEIHCRIQGAWQQGQDHRRKSATRYPNFTGRMMQNDLFSAPPAAPENAAEIQQADTLKPRDQTDTSPYYTIVLDSGYRITYNKEIKT